MRTLRLRAERSSSATNTEWLIERLEHIPPGAGPCGRRGEGGMSGAAPAWPKTRLQLAQHAR